MPLNESYNKNKRKVTVNKKTFDILKVDCEWAGCSVVLPKSSNEFYSHVTSHLKKPADIICEAEDGEEIYKCSWSTCNFETADPKEITRHVKYHGYHAELRALGKYVAKALGLPPCTIQSEFSVLNNVDDSPLICCWNYCQVYSIGIVEFIDHIQYHVKTMYSKSVSYNCLWSECKSVFMNKSKLADHLKTHTKQHFIACPQCGHTFANKTKFVDHCLTQKPFEEHVYQCDYCLTFHPSERILRKHMGQHIHHYKCPFCNMTCNKPSLLAKHVRYRHLNYRSFVCSLCEFKCKAKLDLQQHVLTHVKGVHSCQEPGCSYVTSSQLGMKRHIDSLHVAGKEPGWFCCHLCDKKYKKGAKLTKHLASNHNVKKPPGYSRFLYKLEGDGNRRLQSVRLESIEIHEMMECEESELIDDPEPTEDPRVASDTDDDVSNAITVDVLGDSGQVVSSSIVFPEESLPPEDAQIIAVGT